ncbi:protein translocase subunit SecDF [Hymenobacter negativus]|uniref:Multifunctional fusion protein n=1 Tax=Hymenobacter negativus TaxID=2795026 RepID=A0ABS0QAH2_9BACT|nr:MULTISPECIES: protein translocase subunit SecDF [Bacteria]MBH8559663.1 protein translocase subunit SecDF [Hymenobacter negativus]MBH8570743.1 protein translocase subunit SecDF [Hymenobacter negativus]MBR7210480.1 protein translocase subunit SecDF [Microvirga sp. STS02]
MRNKGLIIALTLVVTALCAYFLFFTYVSRGVQQKAVAYATKNGKLDEAQRQHYLDSVWRAPVYGPFTYREVRQSELGLGLDLKGGMHVTLEVSPVEIVRAMSGNSKDPAFNKSLADAQEAQKTNSGTPFTALFAQAWQQNAAGRPLASIFANTTNKSRNIDINSSNEKVIGAIDKEVEEAIDRSFNILRTRVDKFGVNQPSIQRVKGTGRLQIELPGVDNPDRVRKLLQGQAKLEFWEVWNQNEIGPYLVALDKQLQAKDAVAKAGPAATTDTTATAAAGDSTSLAAQLAKKDKSGKSAADSATANKGGALAKLFTMPGRLGVNLRDTSAMNKILNSAEAKATLPPTLALLWSLKPTTIDKQEYLELIPVRKTRDGVPPLGGEVVSDARADLGQNGQPEVLMSMTPSGARKWQKMTAANIGKQVAMVLDNYVCSAPVVQSEISGGGTSITGSFAVEDTQDLANQLKAGKLPAPTRIVEEAVVGPSLGKEAINQGLYSSLAGVVIIMLFMAFYYGRAGIVADIALLFNIFLILGVLAQFGTALTLPGIAGLILVMGTSVDANVLIFERIREELDHGLILTDAINKGYSRAFSAIFDSNVTTMLIAVILGFFGTGPVQSFAVTLGIGVLTSFLSAVFVSRLIIEWMVKGNENHPMTFSTAISRNLFKNLNFDIVGKRKIAYTFSAAFIILGFVLMFVQGGPNLGVDFKGGRAYVVDFNKTMVASDVADKIRPVFEGAGLEVKQYGAPDRLRITTGYLAEDESVAADQKVVAALNQGLQAYSADAPVIKSTSKVGATIADDIKRTSVLSLGLTLLGIFVYVLFRFEKWQYSMAAVVALFHDALLVIAAFPIARLFGLNYEMDQIFVAALLTVIGFSMNDTVVIYDRIREYLRENPKLTFAQVVNPALNSTFSRTMITFTTVFLVVFVMYVFGGETLRSFSFAMIIGVIFGTYSSLFIATPIILDTYGKKEERERKAAGEDVTGLPGDAPKLSTANV